MTQKNSKRALVLSVLSVVLCMAMLIGTTFAWFTDNASTGVNSIQAGTLDVQLVDANGNSLDGKTLDFVKAEDAESEEILWEPGCTYSLPAVYVKNNGNLALKYKVDITGINGDAKLNEVIDWTINNADINTEYQLAAGAISEAITISGHMQESAGNEYQSLKIEGIAITVAATQDTVEYDSTNNQYDKGASFPTTVSTAAELKTAVNSAKDGDTIALIGDVVLDQPMTISKDITIDGMGNAVMSNKAVTVTADVTFKNITLSKPTSNNKNASIVYAYNGCENLTFEGCTFSDPQWEAMQITSKNFKSLTVNNCIFTAESVDGAANASYGNKADQAIRYIHIQPSLSDGVIANITITNNTFNNCDKVISPVGIYYVDGSTITVGGNTFKELSTGADGKSGALSVGWPAMDALKIVKNWTGETKTFEIASSK